MKDELVLNILAIGSVEWYKNFSTRYAGLSKTYKFEFISDLDKALARLDHNSYDVLIIEDNFIKDNSITLSKKAYAMSRPTIILCSSYLRYISYILWKKFDTWPNRFTTSKEMIFIKHANDLSILDDITSIQKCHKNLKKISNEISSIVF